MAYKTSPNSLIHCASCGEDYSATYRRCPFCGSKNAPSSASGPDPDDPQSPSGRRDASSDLEDTYVFDGQDLFDDKDEDDGASPRSKGGKRLAESPFSNPFANADINWPRVITFICSLVIIVAAMVIVFTWIYPQLRGKDPVGENSQSPSPSASDPGSNVSQDPDSSAGTTDPAATNPGTDPTASVPSTASAELTAIAFSRGERDADFTLSANESHTLNLIFTPSKWSGTVTWASTDTTVATVDNNGKVTNVNTSGNLRSAIITATAGGITLESKVFCKSAPVDPEPSDSEPAASAEPTDNPPVSNPPASDPPTSPSPSGSGTVTVGKKGVIANTGGSGVFVRAEPSTSGERVASLFDGDEITVLEDAGNGWYKIVNGPTEGYIMGEYISTD